jgi:hypothetical protein
MTRFIYKNFWRNGTILTQSTENAQFPAENTQDDIVTLAWRSTGRFVVGATNKYIDFDEGGAELTAIITPGTYTAATLAAEIKVRMDAAGGTYTVTFSTTTGKFTIARTGNFTLRWQSGTNTANTAGAMLGFAVAANDTGAATYTGDNVAIHTSEAIDCDLGEALEYDTVAILGHNLTASAVIKFYGADDDAFTSNVVSDTIAHYGNNIFAFVAAARTKRYVRFYIEDPTNPSLYVKVGVIVIGKYAELNRDICSGMTVGEADETEMETSPDMSLFMVQDRPKVIRWELPFRGLNPASEAIVRLMLANNGVSKALIFCTDYTAANTTSAWVRFTELTPVEKASFGFTNWSPTLEEVL